MNQIARYATVCRRSLVFCSGLLLLVFASGCAGYQLGIGTLHRPEIRTVHVPVFESDSLRRFLGERLTEAVIKEVEVQTPYKVVGSPDADSVLVGRVVDERRRVIGETKNDDARIIGTDLIVTINWYDRRGEALMPESSFAVAPLTFFTASSGDFVPEAGQSLATAHQESIERIARRLCNRSKSAGKDLVPNNFPTSRVRFEWEVEGSVLPPHPALSRDCGAGAVGRKWSRAGKFRRRGNCSDEVRW